MRNKIKEILNRITHIFIWAWLRKWWILLVAIVGFLIFNPTLIDILCLPETFGITCEAIRYYVVVGLYMLGLALLGIIFDIFD